MTTFKGFPVFGLSHVAPGPKTLPASSLVMPYAAEDNACSTLGCPSVASFEWLARLLTVSRSSSGCDGAWPVAWVANGPGNRGGRAMRAHGYSRRGASPRPPRRLGQLGFARSDDRPNLRLTVGDSQAGPSAPLDWVRAPDANARPLIAGLEAEYCELRAPNLWTWAVFDQSQGTRAANVVKPSGRASPPAKLASRKRYKPGTRPTKGRQHLSGGLATDGETHPNPG